MAVAVGAGVAVAVGAGVAVAAGAGGLVGVLVLQGGKGIFDSLCHGIYFALLGNVLPTDNGIDGGFHSGEILVVILLQSICLGNGCIDLGVVGVLVLQGGKGSLR